MVDEMVDEMDELKAGLKDGDWELELATY